MPLDLVWWWYLACASAVVVLWGPGAPQGRPLLFLALHAGLAAVLWGLRRATAGCPAAGRAARGAFTFVGLTIVFSSLGLVLPAVHPEPWEWTWIALDRALFGVDPTIALGELLAPWSVEVLTWAYASFYFVPIVTVAAVGWRRGGKAFDHALLAVVLGFFASYLGYFLWPTLPPYRFLPHERPLEGIWLASWLQEAIDAAELHRWDCFPSGHTLVSVLCLVLAWRGWRALFWILLPVVSLLVLSTVALRYHYAVDVLAGLLLVPAVVWLAERLDVEPSAPREPAGGGRRARVSRP